MFWCWDMFVNRWCTFGPCLAHILDLRWRQVNVAMWSNRFNFVIWIASIKFQKLTLARKCWICLYFWIIYWFTCGIALGVINFGGIWSSCIAIIHLHSHIEYAYDYRYSNAYWDIAMWLQPSLFSLEFVGRSEVIHCIAPFACALKYWYEIFIYFSTWSYSLSEYDTSFYLIINLTFNQIVI